ncbi:MAG TPA: hypothetical protein VHZ95_03315 [Polyangiales bacterium]|nr:hypothetical protein [Polyangiales bacterium]
MSDHTTDRILFALYCFSRDTRQIDATSLARSCAVTATEAARKLVELERLGLVDASRARLTMLGLARAVALGSRGGAPSIDLSQAEPRLPPSAAGIAAQSDEPPKPEPREDPPEPRDLIDPFGPLDTRASGH